MKNFKMILGVFLAVVWGAVFLVLPAHAEDAVRGSQNASAESSQEMNGKAKGRAGFSLSFNASGSTEGDMKSNGMMQDIFNAENTPYYYSK